MSALTFLSKQARTYISKIVTDESITFEVKLLKYYEKVICKLNSILLEGRHRKAVNILTT